jgi:hypothetical protein
MCDPNFTELSSPEGQPRFAIACSLLGLEEPARYVVLLPPSPPDLQTELQLCTVRVFLAQAPTEIPGDPEEDSAGSNSSSGSHVGLIVGATIGGLLGLAGEPRRRCRGPGSCC